jgi:hypothetical protein
MYISSHNHVFKIPMDTDQWLDEINIEDIIPAIVLGVAQSAKAERTP